MLQNIRDNSQGWIAKTIIGVIVVLMALTGFDAIIQPEPLGPVRRKPGDILFCNFQCRLLPQWR